MLTKSVSVACLALVLNGSRPVAGQAKSGDDAKDIQGTWRVTHLEEEGQKVPPDKAKEFVYVFDGKKLTMKYEGKVVGEGSFKLDSSAAPKTINMIHKDETMKGIYKLEGDRLTICASAFEGNKTRPKEFATKAGSKTMLLVLERQKQE